MIPKKEASDWYTRQSSKKCIEFNTKERIVWLGKQPYRDPLADHSGEYRQKWFDYQKARYINWIKKTNLKPVRQPGSFKKYVTLILPKGKKRFAVTGAGKEEKGVLQSFNISTLKLPMVV